MGSAFVCGFIVGMITLAFIASVSNIGHDSDENKKEK